MATVRAKEACYLGTAGYKTPDDGEFEYNGPKHDSLEFVKGKDDDGDDIPDSRYHAMSKTELRAELDGRNLGYAPNAGDKTLRSILEADDAK